MQWQRWNTAIHRDLGYLCFGLTVIYAVSGIAVNHLHDGSWNPNYRFERATATIPPIPAGEVGTDQVQAILDHLGEKRPPKSFFQPDAETLNIYFEEGEMTEVRLGSGEVIYEKAVPRKVLYPMNVLHLNKPKKLWTLFADLYGLALLVLAVTGLFILRGRQGIGGRGAWLTATGIMIPLFFLMLYL